MKRGWLGVGLLVVLLALGIVGQITMDTLHTDTIALLEQAALSAQNEDWGQAIPLAQQAQDRWQRSYTVTAAVADHSPMDDVDKLYAELQVYAQAQDAAHFAATCTQLARMTQAVSEAHSFNLRNLL